MMKQDCNLVSRSFYQHPVRGIFFRKCEKVVLLCEVNSKIRTND